MPRLRRLVIAIVAAALLTGCDTQPATNVTATSATLNAKGGCSGTESGTWRYQIRPLGGTFTNVGAANTFACNGKGAEAQLTAATATGLLPSTTYEYRIHTTLTNGTTMTFDANGTQDGTTWDRFTTLAAPTEASTGGYAFRAETCGTNRGHGTNDVNGTMYAACGTTIVRFDKDNRRLPNLTVGTLAFNAVAVSPTASYIYASVAGRLVRLDRQADGTYRKHATWAPKPFVLNNVAYQPVPRNLHTDEFGNIYVSNAGTDPVTGKIAPTRIIKYAPDGTVMTHFGEHNDEPANPYAFFQNRGLATTRDGRSIYVTSHLQGQVRRFDIQPNGEYRYAQTIGSNDTSCASAGGLAAPSDVALDPWGFVYIPDTSCRKIKKFDAAGRLVAVIGSGTKVLHEIGVNRRGDVFAGEWNRFYTRTAANPVPGPIPAITAPVIDVTAPVLTAIALPATTTTRDVRLTVTATDAVGIAQARVANEDGTWGPWKAYSNPLAHQLTPSLSYKVVYLQVRDAAGNESGTVWTTTQLVAAPVVEPPPGQGPDTTAPTLRGITLPATTTTRTITVAIDAIDDRAVHQARFANEDGNWGPWTAFGANATHQLSAGYSTKGVYVQVRDAAGNESGTVYRTLSYRAA
jgi:hypothetical protein